MKTIVGKWQNLDGTPVAGGRVFLKLSQDAVAFGTTQVSTALISFNLDSTGSIVAGSSIWANDELSPSGTTYSVSVIAAGGGTVWGAENISLVGSSPININNATPASGSTISTAIPVLQNPAAIQTITGFDLNIAGANLNITTGNFVATVGNITASAGNIVVTSGNLTVGGSSSVAGNSLLSSTSSLEWGSVGLTIPNLFLGHAVAQTTLIVGTTAGGNDASINFANAILSPGGFITFAKTGIPPNTPDASLSRSAAGIVQVGSGSADATGELDARTFGVTGSVSGKGTWTVDSTATKMTSSIPVNATTGFQIGGAATSNQALIGNGTNFVSTALSLASAQFANQGTTTTVLHGNAAGNPSFAVVTPSDAVGNTSGSGNFALTTSAALTTPSVSGDLLLDQASNIKFGSTGLTFPDLFFSRISAGNVGLGSVLNGTDAFLNSGGVKMGTIGIITWNADTSLTRRNLTPAYILVGDGGANANGTLQAATLAAATVQATSTVSVFGSVSGSVAITTDSTSTKLNVSTPVNATTGYQIGGVAAANTFLKGNGTNYISGSPVLASADFANQGTTTTVLHGNAAGNPSFSAVSLTADVTGVLPLTNQAAPTGTGFAHITTGANDAAAKLVNLTASTDVAANQGTTTTVLHGNAAGQASFAAVSLTADVSGILPTANGGTGQNSTATFPTSGTVLTDTNTVTTSNKTFTGTGSGNAVTLLNQQGVVAPITGNGTDQTLYTFTIPANTIQAGKGFRVKWYGSNNAGAATLSLKLKIGATTLSTFAIGVTSNYVETAEIYNNAGVQNAQTWAAGATAGTGAVFETFGTSAENFANAIAVTATGNIANPNTFQGGLFMVELIQ